MDRQHYVYALFLKGGQSYVGVRTSPEGIHPDDDTSYLGSSNYVNAEDVLTKLVIGIYKTREEALASEANYHQFYDVAVNPRFANRCRQTATGFDRYGTTTSEETKQKLSEALLGRTHSPETIERRSGENNGMFGRTHTEEAIQKMREAALGENNPFYGRNHTEEARAKIGESAKLRTGENNGMFGRNHSPEAIQKIKEAGSGENHPRYDHRTHWFYNELTGKSITGHQKHLKDNAKQLFELSACSIKNLKSGKRRQVKNWIYLGTV